MIDRTIAPPIHEFVSFPTLNPQRYTLGNGIDCLLLPNVHVAMVQMIVQIKAGAFYQNKLGVSSACLKMLKEGTSHLSSEKIAEQLDYIGSYLVCNKGKDFVSLHIYFQPKATKQVMILLADLLKQPLFPQEQLAIYKQNLKNELAVDLEKTSYIARSRFMKSVFGEHRYGQSLTLNDIEFISRNDLLDFFQQYYHAGNIKIFAAGQIDTGFVDELEKYFGNIVRKTNVELPQTNCFPKAIKQYEEKQDAVQSSLYIGKRCVNKNHQDWCLFSLISLILGGYFGSRLMRNIREDKGLAYHIYSELHSFLHDGVFYVAADVNKSKVKKAIEEIYAEMNDLNDI